jgi:hypothetical protein
MVVAAAAIPLLVWYAADAILNSSDGTFQERPTDPAAPGYEVLVVASPSHMVLGLDPTGNLASVTIVSLASNDRGGTALFLAPETIIDPNTRLGDVYAAEGPEATRQAVADLIDINTDDFNFLDAAGWTGVVNPAAPLSIDNPVALSSTPEGATEPTEVYPQGNIALQSDQVAEYMAWQNTGEALSARLDRQAALWDGWIAAIAAADDPSVIPGERTSGLGRMLAGLASGPFVLKTFPGEDTPLGDAVGVSVDVEQLRSDVLDMVPFPNPAVPGSRPKVKLLDGVGGLDIASTYARPLIADGADIIILGNAREFGVKTTQIIYYNDKFEAEARAFGETLGSADIFFEDIEAAIDIEVIVGENTAGTQG